MKSEPVLLIIAPTILLTHRTALQHGLDPTVMTGIRPIHRESQLRGWSIGTRFIAWDGEWEKFENGYHLRDCVLALAYHGRLRHADSWEVEAHRGEIERMRA